MSYPVPEIRKLQQAHRATSELLHERCGDQATAHLVFPDPRIGRAPWMEIRHTEPIDELIEEIEQRWPSVEFESLMCDEDAL